MQEAKIQEAKVLNPCKYIKKRNPRKSTIHFILLLDKNESQKKNWTGTVGISQPLKIYLT